MVKLWKETTDLKKITDKVYPTSGHDEVKEQVKKARNSKTAKSSKEVVDNLTPNRYPKPKL